MRDRDERMAEAERRIAHARETGARVLDLGDLGLEELPESLGRLGELRELYLGARGPRADGEVEWYFNRNDPQFSELTPLEGLERLERLDLTSCRNVSELAPLSGLSGLQSLNLGFTRVRDVSALSDLSGLQSLDLWNTQVSEVSALCGLSGLQSLYLHGTAVTDFAPLFGLQKLVVLSLIGLKNPISAEALRSLGALPALEWLNVNQATGVPREVLSQGYIDSCLPRLRAYFAELERGAEAENEVKVILLGNGRVGKTQLCRRFRGRPFDQTVESTHGVQLWREALRVETEAGEETFQVNWWDFGGQDIYHGTHALFLRSRAVFVILWTPELENRDEYLEDGGLPVRNQPLAYWLHYVQSLAGEDSPVIVVQSQCDRFQDRQNPPEVSADFGFFAFCSYSAKTDLGRRAFEAHLHDAVGYLREKHGQLEIGTGRAEVRRRLYQWRAEDQERAPEERQHRTLTREEFDALCEEVGDIVSPEHALDYFHQTGVVFYDQKLFEDRIVLDQDWALDAIYTVFHRGRTAPFLRDSGRFTREDLAFLAWQEHSPEEQQLFLGMMESCGICFEIGKTEQGEVRYVAPDLLPELGSLSVRLPAWKEGVAGPRLRLEVEFFHPALMRDLMAEIGQQAGEHAVYWKYGFWLMDGSRDAQVLVRFVDTSTDAAPGAGALEMEAQGRDALGLLGEIRRLPPWRWHDQQFRELLTLDGTTVDRAELEHTVDGQVLDVERRSVAAEPFQAFFRRLEARYRGFQEEESLPAPAAESTLQPRQPTADEKPREIFISYAWGDDSDEGKRRAEAVDALQEALADDGFRPVRDRDEMRSGDSIAQFIQRLTRADLVVAVISDKYLRSPYCMFEIYKLWQRSQADPELMRQIAVPIILPGVRLGTLRERASYIKHWDDSDSELSRLSKELGGRMGDQSWREFRLVREFAHHVDDILVFLNDVLMPRNLDAHLDNGFEAVRDALRRRLEPPTR